MGFDVLGKENGAYFRRTIWYWPSLGTALVEMFPELTAPCKHWFTNDGDGLDKEQSLKLAEAIREALAAGEVERYVRDLGAKLAAIPDETCTWCTYESPSQDRISHLRERFRSSTWKGTPGLWKPFPVYPKTRIISSALLRTANLV